MTKPIWFLIATHLVTLITIPALFQVRSPNYAGVVFVALLFADVALLGIFVALANQSLVVRLSKTMIGLVIVIGCGTMGLSAGDSWAIGLLLGLITIVVGAILTIDRRRGNVIRRAIAGDHELAAETTKFSIRQLLIWTFVAAAIIRIALGVGRHGMLSILFSYSLIFIGISITAPWAVLSYGNLALRSALVVILAIALGFFPPWYTEQPEKLWVWPTVMACQSLMVLFSLLILRRSSYRLVRLSTDSNQSDLLAKSPDSTSNQIIG